MFRKLVPSGPLAVDGPTAAAPPSRRDGSPTDHSPSWARFGAGGSPSTRTWSARRAKEIWWRPALRKRPPRSRHG